MRRIHRFLFAILLQTRLKLRFQLDRKEVETLELQPHTKAFGVGVGVVMIVNEFNRVKWNTMATTNRIPRRSVSDEHNFMEMRVEI